ncbi:MAG TPA: helix-turn-helix domain-containing protein [Solirubrobacteraceae bacterium]|jgi:AcrR family transcriptional regulator
MRQLLLNTTVQLLSQRKPLSTRAIADAAHVSVGTVYRYFDDREEILGLLLEDTIRAIYNDLTSTVGSALDLELDDATRAVIEALTASFERHAPVLRAFIDRGIDAGLTRRVEDTLFPLARVIPARHRPDLTSAQLDDLVFVTMGLTASGCQRIALQRPPGANREAMIEVTARMLAAALQP